MLLSRPKNYGIEFKAFFASPFAPEYQWVRNAVAAAYRELHVDFRAVDEMVMPGTNIVPAIHDQVAQSTFAFVVISGLNPNVLYELGLLHAQSKPTVILADKETFEGLPFDLRSLMVVRYDSDAQNEDELYSDVPFCSRSNDLNRCVEQLCAS